MEDVKLLPILSDVIETLEVQAREKGLELRSAGASPEVAVQADASRLRQILLNVIGNAIKFTKEGEVAVWVTVETGSPYVEIQVRDTGIGIPIHRRDFLVQKFYQADSSRTRNLDSRVTSPVIGMALV